MEEVSLEDFKRKVRGLDDLYDSTLRNGFYLPARSASIISEKYITSVIANKVYCPMFFEVKSKACSSTPMKPILIDKVKAAVAKLFGKPNETGITDKVSPDKK